MSPPRPSAAWSLAAARLPKIIENDARAPALHASLRERAQKLWSDGEVAVPAAPWSDTLADALAGVQREGHLVRGLEAIEKALEREARGLALVDARSATARGSRVSRLLLVGNDGTERFYRQVERLLGTQGQRLLAIRLDADSTQLASAVPDAFGVVRALMIEHKDGVARVLWALYPSLGGG